jgi:protein SCO1/2
VSDSFTGETAVSRKVFLLGFVVLSTLGSVPGPSSAGADDSAARRYFGDVPLIDQFGRRVRFYSDLLKGRVVVIHSFYTTCGGVCPVILRNMAKIQETFGDRLGQDLYLLSITVDPVHDTPERLRAMAARLRARPGWFFLTGSKANVDQVLYRLGFYVEARDDHSTLVLVGNEPRGHWKKVFGFAAPDVLTRIVWDLLKESP